MTCRGTRTGLSNDSGGSTGLGRLKCVTSGIVLPRTHARGDVYLRLLEKLDEARLDLGGQVFDVLGKVQFEGRPLRDLLNDAVRYGQRPEVQARLTGVVSDAFDRERVQDLLEESALAQGLDGHQPGATNTRGHGARRSEAASAPLHRVVLPRGFQENWRQGL